MAPTNQSLTHGVPAVPGARAARTPRLGAIFLTVFLDLLGFGLVLPFLAKEARDVFGVSAFVATLLGSVYSLMQFAFVPIWGRLSDRVGRRPVLIWSIAGTALTMASLGAGLSWGGSVLWLFAARIFGGVATANLGTASAYIADVTKPEERAKGMGLIGAAFGLGFIIGPGIGGALARVAIDGRHGAVPCFVAAGLSLVNLVWIVLGLAESLPPERRATTPRRRLTPLNAAATRDAFALPGVALAVAVNFLVIGSFTNLDQTFTFFCGDIFGIDERGTGYVLAFIGVVAAFVQGGLVRPLAKRVSEASLMRAGALFQVIAFAGLVVAGSGPSRVALYVSGAILALGNGLTQPSTSAFISRRAPADRQGGTLGVNQSFASLARTFGPATGGWLYANVGPRAPYTAAALGMVVALALAMGLKKTYPAADAQRP
ncbi:MAG TPA: MFS transporter [Polyangiaceae bacterium]|jgi:MFS family permease|nr:MFS transporter [Polyangiaceae bacterium]